MPLLRSAHLYPEQERHDAGTPKGSNVSNMLLINPTTAHQGCRACDIRLSDAKVLVGFAVARMFSRTHDEVSAILSDSAS
jgi:hypothetical protein